MPQENPSPTIQNSSQAAPAIALEFVKDKVNRKLAAVLAPGGTPFSWDLKGLRKKLEDEGFGQLEIGDEALVSLLRQGRSGQTGRIALADLHPQIALDFDYDNTSRKLYAVLSESDRTDDLSLNGVKNRLAAAGFGAFNIKDEALSGLALKARKLETGRHPIGVKPEYTRICYALDDATGKLTAELLPNEEETDISQAAIMDELKARGYADFHFEPNALNTLANHAHKGGRGQLVLGQKRNAQIDIEFDEEYMRAYISVSPPQGGREIDRQLLDSALSEAGVYEPCCDQSILETVLCEKSATRLEFARGTEPIDGIDAEFEALVQEVEFTAPKASKSGKIDLREISSFTVVEVNTPLMKRIPAKAGTNGINVKGQVIPALEAIDTPFAEDLEGAKISQEDHNLLLASCNGHPVILADGVRVDNTIVVNDVDMGTGNISYDGSLLVTGEVKPGMKINVTGDIVVKGVVSKASLRAGNNITVECGVIGSDPAKEGETSPPAVLKAGGTIRAQYISLADVSAGRDIEVKEYISHCTSHAKQQVMVGQYGGKGRVFGGFCCGNSGIFLNSLGASGGIKTIIAAGIPPTQQKQLEQLIKSHENRKKQSKQLTELLKKYEQATTEDHSDSGKSTKADAIKKVLLDIDQEIEKMSDTIDRINHAFKILKKAQVSVRQSTFPNVEISINGADFQIRQESKGGIFVKQGQDIRWSNYKA